MHEYQLKIALPDEHPINASPNAGFELAHLIKDGIESLQNAVIDFRPPATPDQIQAARDEYQDNEDCDIEIDDDALISEVGDGYWISGYWVSA